MLLRSSDGAASAVLIARRQPGKCELFVAERLTRSRLHFLALVTIVVGSLVLAVSFLTTVDNRTLNGLGLGSDYLAFHDAGIILNKHGGDRLYDLGLQSKLYHENLPGEPNEASLPFAYAPFLALLFRPLAMLPYAWSYAAWIAISVTLFVTSFALIWRAARLPPTYFYLALLCALAFEPFAIECLHGGQIAPIGLFALSCAIYLALTRRPFTAGSILALCTYKPTLLPLILPMLVIMRQRRVLVGFATGAMSLATISLIAVGPHACADYARLLINYVDKTSAASGGFQTWKFVDLNSSIKLLGASPATALAMLTLLGLPVLCRVLQSRPRDPHQARRLLPIAWAAAISWTMVLNIYVGVYDSILVIPAIVLTCGELLRRSTDTGRNLPIRLRCLLVGVWVLPWFSGLLARDIGFQPFTFALAALGSYQLNWLGRRSSVSSECSSDRARMTDKWRDARIDSTGDVEAARGARACAAC